jgi:uncharacterized membrane protein
VTWELSFRVRQYLSGSLWVLPLVGTAVGFVLGHLGLWLDRSVDVPSYWQYSASTATTVLAAIIGAVAALAGFVVTVTVLVVQMATGTFSARYMRLFYRDRLLKTLLAALVGTITFSFSLLRQIETDSVPDLGVTASGALVALNLLLFLLFLDRFIHRLRPVAVAAIVARAGRRAIAEAEQATGGRDGLRLVFERYEAPAQPALVVRSARAGAVQAVDARGLVRFARRHGCLLVLRRPVGDFVPAGAVLLDVYGGTADGELAERRLRGMIALGDERTIEQDPTFALRVMVDIAIRALSPAINDPTTATQVVDHLGETLRQLGSSPAYAADAADGGRDGPVLVPGRRWADVLLLGVTEIRRDGASSVQVSRRLRAMLEELHDAVPPDRRAAVEAELARLDATVGQSFGGTVDLELAAAADHQGVGGAWTA